MADARLSHLTDLASGDSSRILEVIDQYRPYIVVGADAGPAARLAALSLYSMTARLFPHTIIDGAGEVGVNPWGVTRIQDLPEVIEPCLPRPAREPARDIRLGIAIDDGADLYLGGDDWSSRLGRVPVAYSNGPFPIGWQGSAVLAATEVAKTVWAELGLVVNPIAQFFEWNYLDYRLRAAGPALAMRPIDIAFFGAGSVGSSAVGVSMMIEGLKANATVVDNDDFDPSRNPFRYPSARCDVTGPKAKWLAKLLTSASWHAKEAVMKTGEWVAKQPEPGWFGLGVSSVDDIDGRFEVTDVLARTTLSIGIAGLQLHIQREHLGDGYACPFCDFVNEHPAISESQAQAQFTGLSQARIETLHITDERLTYQDVQAVVGAGRIKPEASDQMVGRRLVDLLKRIYADAVIPAPAGGTPTPVGAPHVSWAAGVLAAAEIAKAAMGIELVDRRIDLDLVGLPQGQILKRPADTSGRCACFSPIRRQWMAKLYQKTS